MYSLISNKIFCFDVNDKTPEKILFSNYELALRVALRIASRPTTYKYESGEWEEQKFEKKKLNFPTGIISDSQIDVELNPKAEKKRLWQKVKDSRKKD